MIAVSHVLLFLHVFVSLCYEVIDRFETDVSKSEPVITHFTYTKIKFLRIENNANLLIFYQEINFAVILLF